MESGILANLSGGGCPTFSCRNSATTSTASVAFGTRIPLITVAGSRLAFLGYDRCRRHNSVKLHFQGNRCGFNGSPIMIGCSGTQSLELRAPAAVSKENGVTRAASQAGGEQATAQDTASESKAKVTFKLEKQIHFGQTIKVVGSTPELGRWDQGAAVPLVWSEGHIWTGDVAVTVGQSVEYKFILTGNQGELDWQPGENRVFEVKDGGDLLVSEPWDTSGATVEQPEESSTSETSDTADTAEDVMPVTGEGSPVISVVPGADLVEGVAAAAKMASSQVQKAVGDSLPEDIIDDRKDKEGEGEAEEASEIPVVDAIIATAVAQGKDDDNGPAPR